MPESPFESSTIKHDSRLSALTRSFSSVEPDRFFTNTYRLSYKIEDALVTMRIVIDDEQSGADLAITNMTTLSEQHTRRGYGSTALQLLLAWADEHDMKNIQAVQVQPDSEGFWTASGFKKMNNHTNDFMFEK